MEEEEDVGHYSDGERAEGSYILTQVFCEQRHH